MTVESVIENARKEIDYGEGVLLHLTGKRANEIFDCIEASHKREVAELRERLDATNKVVDDELKKQAHCRGCEWRGKNIRGEPACPCGEDVHGVVFDIDVTDRIVSALRGDILAEKGKTV